MSADLGIPREHGWTTLATFSDHSLLSLNQMGPGTEGASESLILEKKFWLFLMYVFQSFPFAVSSPMATLIYSFSDTHCAPAGGYTLSGP